MNLEIPLSYVILSFISSGWLVGIFETTSIREKAQKSEPFARFSGALTGIIAIVLMLIITFLGVYFKPIGLAIVVSCSAVIYFYHFRFRQIYNIFISCAWVLTTVLWLLMFFR